jgi:steroid 5-alpha reductase family enzyme
MDTTMLLNWIDPELGSVLLEMSLLSCLALIISSIGFYRVVYFISIGYAFSIVAMSIITPLWHFESITWASALQNIFLTLWGLRLGIYLVQREFRASYREELTDVHQRSSGMTWVTKTAIWASVSILYVLMFSPSLFTLISTPVASVWMFHLVQIAGLLFMGGGLVLEAVSDKQKSDFKSRFPKQYCNVGLYRWVRCPNYFGEITFWVGNWIMGAVFYNSPLKWVASSAGMVCIVLIMMGSTKRLERTQDERYGSQPEYQDYIRMVPVLFPFIPVYSLKKVRVYLE